VGYAKLNCHIRGVVPCIQHNGQMCDPLNRWAKAIKAITGKRKKTDDDHAEIARLEWFASLYLDKDGEPCWPGENIEGLLIASAKKQKSGPTAKAAVIVDGNHKLIYTGPKDPEKLWNEESFRSIVRAKVQQSAIMRCRPIFHNWELKFTVSYLPDLLDLNALKQWIEIGGREIGLSEWRPKYGRYEVVEMKNVA